MSNRHRQGINHIPEARQCVDGLSKNDAWMVTGYIENPDGRKAGRATLAPTQPTASLTRDRLVAGETKITQSGESSCNTKYSRPQPWAKTAQDFLKNWPYRIAKKRQVAATVLGNKTRHQESPVSQLIEQQEHNIKPQLVEKSQPKPSDFFVSKGCLFWVAILIKKTVNFQLM
jgi:hypothetical protein